MSQLPRSLLSNSFGIYMIRSCFVLVSLYVLLASGHPNLSTSGWEIYQYSEQTSPMQSNLLFGSSNEPSGVATEGERSMVNPKAAGNSDYRQAVDTIGRPHEAGLKGNIRNVVSHVTDFSGFRNIFNAVLSK